MHKVKITIFLVYPSKHVPYVPQNTAFRSTEDHSNYGMTDVSTKGTDVELGRLTLPQKRHQKREPVQDEEEAISA